MRTPHDVDVAILGAGFPAGLLALTLARRGVRVGLLADGDVGRFAVGETTIPYVTSVLELIADRFGVPEVADLTRFDRVRRRVAGTCGRTLNLGFLYHQPGAAAVEPLQFNFPGEHAEYHAYRPDVDAHLAFTAARFGATLRERVALEDWEVTDRYVRLQTSAGEEFRARCLVDLSGRDSPVVRRLGWREEPTRLRHASRSVYTHMVGVAPYESLAPAAGRRMPGKWSAGTLHHVFDGGWAWAIPFDNHRDATSPLCSVGLTLAGAAAPDLEPEELFRKSIDRYPALAAAFADARPARAWVAEERVQYSTRRCVADRVCVAGPAASGTEQLFSRELANGAELAHALARVLLEAVKDDDFSAERLRPIERLQQGIADQYDELLRGAYVALRDFQLWNVYVRVWLLGSIFSTLMLRGLLRRFRKTGDAAYLAQMDQPGADGHWVPQLDGYRRLWAATVEACAEVEAGRLEPAAAAECVGAQLREDAIVPPFFGFGDPNDRCYRLTLWKQIKTVFWVVFRAPPEVRRLARAYV